MSQLFSSLDRSFLTAAIDRQYRLFPADLEIVAAVRQLRAARATIGIVCDASDERRLLGAVSECDLLRSLCGVDAELHPGATAEAATETTAENSEAQSLGVLRLAPTIALPQGEISTFTELLAYHRDRPSDDPSEDRESSYIVLLDDDDRPCGAIGPSCWQSIERWQLPQLFAECDSALAQQSSQAVQRRAYRLELERQRALEELFAQIDASLQASSNIEAALQLAVDGLRSLLHGDRVFIYQNDSDVIRSGDRLLLQAVADDRWWLDPNVFAVDDFADAAWQKRARNGQIVTLDPPDPEIGTVELRERDRQFLQQIGARTAIVVEIVVNGDRWATLVVNNCIETRDNDAQTDLATKLLFAKQIAVRLGLELEHFEIFDRLEVELQERWRAEQQVRQLNEQLEANVRERTQELEAANRRLVEAARENELLAVNARTAESNMRTFFSAMTEIAIVIDAQIEVLGLAPTNPQLLYGERTDVFERTVEMLYELDPDSAIGCEIRQTIEMQSLRSVKYSLIVDGSERWFRAHISPNSTPGQATWVARDITALENSEAARAETEDRLGLLLDGISEYGIFELALDGTIVTWNTGAERIHGYTEAEVLNHPYAMLFHDSAIESGDPERELERARTGGRYEIEGRRRHRQGHSVWADVAISALYDRDRRPRGFAIVMCDITEAHRNKSWQQLLERAIDACTSGVIVSDATQPHNPIVYVNSGFEVMTGYSEYEAIGRNWEFLQRKDTDQPDLEVLRRAIQDGVGCSVTLRHYRRDGSMFWNEMTISPVRSETGTVVNYIGFANDVTASRESEIELTTLNAKLQAVLDATCDVAIVSTTPEGIIQLANAGARRLLGCSDTVDLQEHALDRFFVPEEIQRYYIERHPEVSRRDLPTNFECLTCCGTHDDDIEAREWQLRRFDGKTLRVGLEIEPILGERGQSLGFVAIVQDVTERSAMQLELNRSKMLLTGVLDSSIDGIMAFRSIRDPDTQAIVDFEWIVANAAASRFVASPDDNLVGKRFRQTCSLTHVLELFDAYVAVAEDGSVLEREIYRTQTPRGHWFHLTAVRLGDGLAVTMRNITKTKNIETVLQQTNEELQTKIQVLNSRNRDMTKLGELNEYLQACETVREAYETVAARMSAFFPGCAGALYQIQGADRLASVATWGDRVISDAVGLKLDCWALRRSRPHLMERGHNELFCNHVQACSDVSVSLCLPLSAQGSSFGLLHIWSVDREALPDSQHQLAGAVSEQLALSIANLKLRESLEQQSTRDPLTGLFNRRYMEDVLDRLLHAAHLHDKHLGLVMIDIDRFKSYNDRYGHAVGDLVLREVAQSISSVLHPSEIACRYGGEELIAILPDTSAATIYQRAEQIRQRIADLQLSHAGKDLDRVTASFGVASFPECGEDRRALMRVADDALYRAKNDGRNCVRLAEAIADRVHDDAESPH